MKVTHEEPTHFCLPIDRAKMFGNIKIYFFKKLWKAAQSTNEASKNVHKIKHLAFCLRAWYFSDFVAKDSVIC